MTDKQALLGPDKHSNQHRLFRLIVEANSAKLRDIAEAVEHYTDQLIAALEAAEKHIAELESKNSNLRTIAHEQNELAIRASLDSNSAAVEMDKLHKRIAELEARTVIVTDPFYPDGDTGYPLAVNVSAVRAACARAGIRCVIEDISDE